MSELGDNLSKDLLRKRYLRVLRQTIRQKLEIELDGHFEDRNNFNHYLEKLFGKGCLDPNSVHSEAVAWKVAKDTVEQCKPIHSWFNLDKFWEDQEKYPESERGHDGFLNIIRRLLVRLHGFWVFTLDDTNHTFRFISPQRHTTNGGQNQMHQSVPMRQNSLVRRGGWRHRFILVTACFTSVELLRDTKT